MKVTVRLFTALRELAGQGRIPLEFDEGTVTIHEVSQALSRRYGQKFNDYLFSEDGKVREYLQLLVNGRSVSGSKRLETTLVDGDVLAIVPPVSGG